MIWIVLQFCQTKHGKFFENMRYVFIATTFFLMHNLRISNTLTVYPAAYQDVLTSPILNYLRAMKSETLPTKLSINTKYLLQSTRRVSQRK